MFWQADNLLKWQAIIDKAETKKMALIFEDETG
jgi:hypothetical protein